MVGTSTQYQVIRQHKTDDKEITAFVKKHLFLPKDLVRKIEKLEKRVVMLESKLEKFEKERQ